MSGYQKIEYNLKVEGNIITTGTVDGRDILDDGTALDAHIASTSSHGISGNIVGTTDTQTLTNKSLTNANCFHVDGTDSTKKIGFVSSSASTGTTLTIAGQQTTSQTLSIPNITSADTIVTLAIAQTLTNKTLTSPIISTISNTGTLTLPTSTDTLVGRATTDTLTNKTLTDATTYFQDDVDNTKKVQLQLSGLTTATTRTLTIPDASTTLVGTDATQTLTNKTLTAPIISTISNTGTLTLPTSTDTLIGRATTDTLTNKSLNNTSVFHVDNADGTKKIGFQSSGATTGTTLTLAGAQTTNRTVTLPDATTTLVGIDTTQTLTNKSLNNASCFHVDGTDTTKKIGFQSSGATTATTLTIADQQTTSQTLNVPNITATDTIVTTGLAQTISSVKTFANAPNMSSLTASQAVVTDGSKNLASLAYTSASTASTLASRDANANISAVNLIEGYTTTATAAGTTTLTVASTYQQFFTGSTTQTVVLPVTSTLVLGQSFCISNCSTGIVTVQSSGLNTVQALASNSSVIVTCILTTGTTAASWAVSYIPALGSLTFPTSTDTVVARATTDTLTNKSLVNASCFHVDGTDATKKIGFQSSSATTGTTLTLVDQQTTSQSLSIPNVTSGDTITTINATQTLSNKSFNDGTSVVFVDTSNPTNTLYFNVNGGGNHQVQIYTQVSGTASDTINIPDLSGTTDTFAMTGLSQTITNKSITNANNFFVDGTTPTKKIGFQSSAATASTTLTIASQQTTSQTLSVPNITGADTIATTSATQTLTNKTITGSTNTIAASQLRTAASDVVVSAASAPTTGQALIAASSTTASWQNISGITWRNTWNSGTTYAVNDCISSGGSSWICVLSHTNQVPPNATYWNMVVDGFHWKGTWSGATAYIVNDVVSLSGTTYICILGNTNNTPPNATYWAVLATTVPAGSTTQVQYNNAGSIAGATKLTIDSSDGFAILGEDTGAPPTAPSNGAKLFSRLRAGRNMSAQIGPSGVDYSFQPSVFSNKISWWTAQGNGTTVTVINFGNTATGTATTRNVATTSFFTSLRRIGYVSTSTAGSSAGTRHGAQQFWMGNASGLGGFFYVARFGLSSASSVATQRSFVGLVASTAVIGNVDPSSQTNILGFGVDAADSTWTFMHNDGSGTATKDALTGTFPARDLSVSMFEVRIYCKPNTTTIYYSLEVLNGGSIYDSSTTTDIPASTTLLSPQIWTNNGSTALACGIDVVSQYIETDN